jgi:hypothetical protein
METTGKYMTLSSFTSSLPHMHMYTHAYVHICAHARVHTCTHTETLTQGKSSSNVFYLNIQKPKGIKPLPLNVISHPVCNVTT